VLKARQYAHDNRIGIARLEGSVFLGMRRDFEQIARSVRRGFVEDAVRGVVVDDLDAVAARSRRQLFVRNLDFGGQDTAVGTANARIERDDGVRAGGRKVSYERNCTSKSVNFMRNRSAARTMVMKLRVSRRGAKNVEI
jgi:hypothetical protein